MKLVPRLVAILLTFDVYQIHAFPKSQQDPVQFPKLQSIEINPKKEILHENLEGIISMKDPTSVSYGHRSWSEEVNKLEFIDRKLENHFASSEATPITPTKPELSKKHFDGGVIKNGMKLIESANYECNFNEENTKNTIICKEGSVPPDSNVIDSQKLPRPLSLNFGSESDGSDVAVTTESMVEFTATGVDNSLEEVSKLEELFSQMMDIHTLARKIPAERNPNFTSYVFNPVAQPEEKFQNCTTPANETGNCRYIQHCLIPSILGNLNQFMQYVCIIEGSFIGVCCPELPVTEVKVDWPQNETSQEEASTASNSTDDDSECGIATNVRIVGGSNADRKAWPWMVALLAKSRDAFFCGGTLINNRYVLTAAHCTFGVPKNMITARLGEYDLKAAVHLIHEDYAVVKIKRHGQYSQRTLQNDIALLLLEKAVTYNNFIMTICLPEKHLDYVNRTATLAGWGNLEGGGPNSDVLQVASFPVIANNDCQSEHGVPIDDSVICTGSDDKGACNGDSGGPLMLLDDNDRWKTIAIVSWGRRGCSPKFPTVYTRVSYYLDWIRKHSNLSEESEVL